MKDSNFKFLVIFTALYGLVGLGLLAGQPRVAAMQTADAGGNFEAPASGWSMIMVASAE
jgi:hypothetical protein